VPAGYAARPASIDDVDTVTDLIAATESHDDGEIEIARDDVVSSWARPSFDPVTNAVIVTRGDEPVGWAEVYRARRTEADVRPDQRGRGIGRALLRWTEDRAREAGGTLVGQTVTDHNTGAAALFRANGYDPLWTSWLLQIGTSGGAPTTEPPDGVEIRRFRTEDQHAVYRVIEDAFSAWPDRDPEPFENWHAGMLEHGAFSADLSRLAFVGDRVIGAALALDYGPDNEGWVQQLAVDAGHRHRGIARALLSEVFRAFAERGASACGLSTDSRTGALGLYEKIGMHVRRSYTHWAKQLD
jgi:ribosomal protein S18 acetylase RimI-like enzyme